MGSYLVAETVQVPRLSHMPSAINQLRILRNHINLPKLNINTGRIIMSCSVKNITESLKNKVNYEVRMLKLATIILSFTKILQTSKIHGEELMN